MSDLRFAVRQLVRRPGFAALAIGTVALAVGATTAIFSVVDAVLFRPLPYPESSRLVTVVNTYPHWRDREILSRFWDNIQLSYPEFETLRAENTVYEAVAVHQAGPGTYFGTERPEPISFGSASHTLDEVLRVSPTLGRWFDESEDRPGGDPVAVVRHEFWQTRLGGDSAVLGRPLRIDDQVYTVIGVLPPGFRFTDPNSTLTPEVWLPVGRGADQFDEGSHNFNGIGRLAAGVSLSQAHDETQAILRGDRSPDVRGARVVSRKEQDVAAARPVLLMVLGAVGLILLLACANVGNLLLGRAVERDQEIAVRLALGATRRRLSRLVLVESLVIAVAGGVLGTLGAWWGVGGLVDLIPVGVPRLAEVAVDLRVLGFALALSLLAGLLFGAAPLYAARRRDVHERLKDGARHTSSHARLQGGLVVAQVSLAVVLLVGSLLLVRSLVAVYDVDVGFEREGILSFRLDLPLDRYGNGATVTAFYDALSQRLRGVPGVTATSATSILPLQGGSASNSVWLASYGAEDGRAKPEAERRIVGVEYFDMLDIGLVAGRTFSESDRADAPLVMVVSRRAAQELWGGRSPIGDRVELDDRWWIVVGVVDDIRDRRPDAPPQRMVYVPFAQWQSWQSRFRTIAVRTAVPPLTLTDEVHRVVGELDPLLPVTRVQSMDQVMRNITADHRFRALLVSAFGLLAALLAGIGIFGVTAHAVARRTREVGVRVALGATKQDVLRLVLGRVGVLASIGLVLGLAGSVAAGRVLQRFLFGVSPTDPATVGLISALVLGLALAAGLVPALRAARSAPMEALRYE